MEHTNSPRARSVLEPHRKYILERWIGLNSVNSIANALSKMGCTTSAQNLQKWINSQVKDGSFPSRAPSGQGRPRAQTDLSSSLGILPLTANVDDFAIPTIVFLMLNAPNIPINFAEHAMEEMGIPQLEIGEPGWLKPDWKGYAKQLGLARVRSLGDMDYFALAAVFMNWTDHFQNAKTDTSWKKKWIPKVAFAATKLRNEMLLAASGD